MKINNRILIVDDEKDIHTDFDKILSPFRFTPLDKELLSIEAQIFDEAPKQPLHPASRVEYQIDNALRGEAALELIAAAKEAGRPYALIFTDVRIPPGIDGVQLVSKILEMAPDTQVVIVTAFSDYTWEELVGFFGWTDRLLILRKPVDPITVKQVALMLTRKWTSELELRRHRLHLESMVEMRTAKLTRTNEQLQSEIAERLKAEEALQRAHARLAEANQELQFEITQRRQTEEQLRVLLQELEIVNQELENFAYIVSHDLKAPLRAISSICSWFSEDYSDKLDERGNSYLADLLDQTQWMHNLVEGILQYSRLGRAKFELKEWDCHYIVSKLIEFLAPPSAIMIRIEGQLPKLIYDRTHLEQVFQNLIGNAIQHMGGNEGEVVISCEQDSEQYTFTVRDTGIGIDPKHFERIFKIFQTLKPRDTAEQSTGIGLSLVRRIVERHGGSVWVNSVVGEGSSFYFTISKDLRPTREVSPTVLVIDDNADFCSVAEAMLKRAGCKPIQVNSGQEAIKLVTGFEGKLGLTLLDLNLPGEDVIELYRNLKQLQPEMHVLICTGHPHSYRSLQLQRMGVDGILEKPFNIETLSEALDSAFS